MRGKTRAGIAAGAAATCLAASATAGPWARGAGNVFFSVTHSAEESLTDIGYALAYGTVAMDPNRTTSVYGEIGIGQRLTGGIDLQFGEFSQMSVAFLRYTLTRPGSRWQIALDAGAGSYEVEGLETRTLTRLGASLGLGFGAWSRPIGEGEIGHNGGWISLDAHMLADAGERDDAADPIWQSELTFGLNMNERVTGILAFKAENWPGADRVISARPSVVFGVTDRTSVQAGAHAALEGSDDVGLSLSLWQEF